MDKEFADRMIGEFQKKFFGYALSKTANLDEAEELAARIVCEAYSVLRSAENIYNWEGYLYRIAANVYARYVAERKRSAGEDLNEMEIGDSTDFVSDIFREEEAALLKREVAWLTRRHREIVLLYYYHEKKIPEIAKLLDIPQGTVKWHLSDARKSIKEGMKSMRGKGNLGLEPIRFVRISHTGDHGSEGAPENFLNTRLRQNIAYAAYYTPKSVQEIAQELGVSPVYVEDEVDYLEEHGFLDLRPGSRYRTNIFITDIPPYMAKRLQEIDRRVAQELSRKYFPVLQETFKDYRNLDIYVPEDDYNYLLWSLVPMAVSNMRNRECDENIIRRVYCRKLKDGGEYMAYATVCRGVEEEAPEPYEFLGDMYRRCSPGNIGSWSVNTRFDTRQWEWQDNRSDDYGYLHLYMENRLPKIEALVGIYERLYERGLLAQSKNGSMVNVVVVKQELLEDGKLEPRNNPLLDRLPPLSQEMKSYVKENCREKILLAKQYYPEHMHQALECRMGFEINPVMLLEVLLEKGALKPLSENQRKGVMTEVSSDILP